MKYALLAAAFLALQPGALLACSLVPDDRPMDVQLDEWTRTSYSKAQVMAEVVAVQGSRRHRSGSCASFGCRRDQSARDGLPLSGA